MVSSNEVVPNLLAKGPRNQKTYEILSLTAPRVVQIRADQSKVNLDSGARSETFFLESPKPPHVSKKHITELLATTLSLP